MTQRRRARLALTGVLAVALSVTVGMAASAEAAPKKGKKKSTNKVRTFRSNAAQPIPDRAGAGTPFGQLYSTIKVGKVLKGKEVADVDAAFSTTGPANELADLDVMLQAPNGALVMLANDNAGTAGTTSYGTGNCTNGATAFNDETGNFLSNGDPPSADPFGITAPWVATVQPEGFPLAIMDGGKAVGTWRLIVFDDTTANSHTLNCWRLTIKPRNAQK